MQTIRGWYSNLSVLCTVACAAVLAPGPSNSGLVWAQPPQQAQTDKVDRTVSLQNRVATRGQRAAVPTPMRLIDARGMPVAGAVIAGSFRRDADREPFFTPEDMSASKKSDARGEALLELDVAGRLDGAGVYAIRQGKGRPLVGIRKVTRFEIGMPISIIMQPACRVLFQIDSAGLSGLEKEYNVELTGPRWSRAAYLRLGGTDQDPRPLFTCSVTGKLEFLLPPGRFEIHAHADDVRESVLPLEIKPEDRELLLGTIDLVPGQSAKRGYFPFHRHVRVHGENAAEAFALRLVVHRGLHGRTYGVRDLAFSPDGKMVASAHMEAAAPAEVKLWDWQTGLPVAALGVRARAVSRLAFSRDGKRLYGLIDPVTRIDTSPAIVEWDMEARRVVRELGGPGSGVVALALSPDDKTLASSGENQTQLWDLASGRETARIPADATWCRCLAFAPDGQGLTIGSSRKIQWCRVDGDRSHTGFEVATDPFTVCSMACSADGRTLAVAGCIGGPDGKSAEGQVWLYEVDPPGVIRRRAVLRFDRLEGTIQNELPPVCSDVVFTPDGRLVAVAGRHVRTWSSLSAKLDNAFMRLLSSSSDRLAVSPDGQWLAIIGPTGVDCVDVPPSP